MNTKYVIKLIQQGQTQKIQVVASGAGMAGQAVVIQAVDAGRFYLNDIVTLTSPAKLQIKRVGSHLHLALPGGDIGAPDVVIEGYFSVKNASLWGSAATGEWMGYDTSGLANSHALDAANVANTNAKLPSGYEPISQISLSSPSSGPLALFDSPWGLAGLAAGAAVLGASSKSSGSTASTTLSSDQILTAYATSTSNTAPTLANYISFGIKALASLSDTSDASRVAILSSNTSLDAINSAVAKLGAANISKEKVQAAVDSYYRIFAESDDNASDNTDVYADTTNDATNAAAFNDPKLSDYAAIGVTVVDAISTTTYNTGTGAGHETLDLLNNAIGRLSTTAVNSASKIEALATTANDVMLMAKQATGSTPAPSQNSAGLIANLNILLGLTTTTGVNTTNITAFKAAIVASADDGSGVKTVGKLIEILGIARLQAFTDDTGALGSKTAATPTITDWTLAGTGLTANTSLTDASRVALNQATYWKTTNSANGLTALNSALDTFSGSLIDQTKLQILVDAYGRILQAADGSRSTDTDVSYVDSVPGTGRGRYLTQTDLELVGVNKGGSDNGAILGTDTGLNYQMTGELLASVIGSLSSTTVDTVSELNTLTGYAETVMKQAAAGPSATVNTTDAFWIAAVNGLLGTSISTGANTSNITAIKDKIDAANATTVDSYDELQALVSLVRLNDYASASSGYTTPTLGDFQAVSLSGGQTNAYTSLKSEYLSAYNSATFAQTGMTDANSAGSMVAKYTALLNSADGNTGNAATLSAGDFNSILGQSSVTSVSTVSADTVAGALNNIIDSLGYTSLDSTSELANLAAIMGKVFTMAANTKTTGAGTADYAGMSKGDLGLLGLKVDNSLVSNANITDAEFTYFNTQLIYSADTGIGVNTLSALQTLLNQAVLNA